MLSISSLYEPPPAISLQQLSVCMVAIGLFNIDLNLLARHNACEVKRRPLYVGLDTHTSQFLIMFSLFIVDAETPSS